MEFFCDLYFHFDIVRMFISILGIFKVLLSIFAHFRILILNKYFEMFVSLCHGCCVNCIEAPQSNLQLQKLVRYSWHLFSCNNYSSIFFARLFYLHVYVSPGQWGVFLSCTTRSRNYMRTHFSSISHNNKKKRSCYNRPDPKDHTPKTVNTMKNNNRKIMNEKKRDSKNYYYEWKKKRIHNCLRNPVHNDLFLYILWILRHASIREKEKMICSRDRERKKRDGESENGTDLFRPKSRTNSMAICTCCHIWWISKDERVWNIFS